MPINDEHIGRRCMWTERNNNVKYGTIKTISGAFANMNVDGSSRENYFVPIDTVTLVDEDDAPIT